MEKCPRLSDFRRKNYRKAQQINAKGILILEMIGMILTWLMLTSLTFFMLGNTYDAFADVC